VKSWLLTERTASSSIRARTGVVRASLMYSASVRWAAGHATRAASSAVERADHRLFAPQSPIADHR
jgi:hypothetical protein